MDQELSKSLAHRGGMGLGKMVYEQMIRKEERKQPQTVEGKPAQVNPGRAREE